MLLVTTKLYGVESCDIFIHGKLKSTNYFGSQTRHVDWDSTLDIEDAAEQMAPEIINQMNFCDDLPIILRPHNYAAPVIYTILGLGKRYANTKPHHDYVQIFKRVLAVYSFMGAYSGTPLMDLICAGGAPKEVTQIMGEECVPSMTTSKLFHASSIVTSPGIPIFLIYSTNSRKELQETGHILSQVGLTWNEVETEKIKNLNDGIVPLSSSKACKRNIAMTRKTSRCENLDEEFFIDFLRSDEHSHLSFLNDHTFLHRRSHEE